MTLFAILTLAIAAGPIAWLFQARIAGARQWLAASAATVAMSGAALVVGPWVLLSLYVRPIIIASLIAAVAVGARRARRRAIEGERVRPYVWHWSAACLFGFVLIDGVAGWATPDRATDLRFPLERGTYAVLQGGNSFMTNPFHHWFRFDRYGLDLVRVNALGNRARGIAPPRLSDYASYDVAVHSPCPGVVEEAINDLPDHPPGTMDPEHISGNHVLLRCGALRVLLAHLRRGSLEVDPGDSIHAGQLVGRIGNSGNTNEPHLHVGAVSADSPEPWREAAGVPITFEGRFLSINDLVR